MLRKVVFFLNLFHLPASASLRCPLPSTSHYSQKHQQDQLPCVKPKISPAVSLSYAPPAASWSQTSRGKGNFIRQKQKFHLSAQFQDGTLSKNRAQSPFPGLQQPLAISQTSLSAANSFTRPCCLKAALGYRFLVCFSPRVRLEDIQADFDLFKAGQVLITLQLRRGGEKNSHYLTNRRETQ